MSDCLERRFNVVAFWVFAEFERSMITERVRAGLRRAKDEGKQLGRPRIDADLE
jgi:DNA invertase Pin-like site-specific DNA recombinase